MLSENNVQFCVLSFNLLINMIKLSPSTEMKNINQIKSVVGILKPFLHASNNY